MGRLDRLPIRCPTGKMAFKTLSAAASVAMNMRVYHLDPFIRHYQCKECGYWHTGHPAGTQRKRGS